MNHHSDIDRVLTSWMADGPAAIPDRVVDVVAARIGVQRQRRTWPFPRRTNVTTQIKLIAALAAVLVVAVVGYSLLPGTTGPGGPTPTPTATSSAVASASPSTAPSAGVACPLWLTIGCGGGAGILQAGSHKTSSFRPGFTYSVPSGFVNDGDTADYFSLFPYTPTNQAEFARSGEIAQSIVMGPHNSPYFVCDAWEDNSGATAAEIVDAMLANEALAVTGVADVEIGGLTGKRFGVGVNPDWTEPCPGDPPGSDPRDQESEAFLLDSADRGVLVIFVGCKRVLNWMCVGDQALIVESFEFDLEQ